MILLTTVTGGFLVSVVRAVRRNWQIVVPDLRLPWLIVTASIPHLIAFNLTATSKLLSDREAAVTLMISLGLLVVFAWSNRRISGFPLLGLGLALNLLVIAVNGGLMPITPQAVQAILPHAAPGSWQIGQRLGYSKDIVLLLSQTRLYFLSDCLLLPTWIPYRVAFSAGDILIALGSVWTLWAAGSEKKADSKYILKR